MTMFPLQKFSRIGCGWLSNIWNLELTSEQDIVFIWGASEQEKPCRPYIYFCARKWKMMMFAEDNWNRSEEMGSNT